MAVEGLDGAALIESTPFIPITMSVAAVPESGPTLDDALRQGAHAGSETGPNAHSRIDREVMRDAAMLDLWVNDRAGIAARQLALGGRDHESALSFEPRGDEDKGFGFDLSPAPRSMSFGSWYEWQNYDPEQYMQEVSSWYGFEAFGYDQFSDRLEEWGRQIQEWVHSILPGSAYPDIVVTGPSGVEFGDDYEIIFHGDGLISLFQDGVFLHGLEATTPNHATIVITIANPTYQAGISTPRGGVEGQTSGGSTITYYFRNGQ